jgi:amidophosphoribosyltransferase
VCKIDKYLLQELESMEDTVGMECGVFSAIDFKRRHIFPYVYWGMRAQNHRGHQSHGFITFDSKFNVYRSLDLIPKIKKSDVQNWLRKLPGSVGLGNVRYTTSGRLNEDALIEGTQPTLVDTGKSKLAISFNGNVVNTVQLRKELCHAFPDFSYECDAELICRKLSIKLLEGQRLESAVKTCMMETEGAFSVSGITEKGDLFAFKDPHGIRPLCSGCSSSGDVCSFSSETVGFDINGFEYRFEIEPGEFVLATESGFERKQLVPKKELALCAFEFAPISLAQTQDSTTSTYMK